MRAGSGSLPRTPVAAVERRREHRGRARTVRRGGRHHQLRIRGRPELVDPELADRDPLLLQLHALGVPEAGRGVDLAGGEIGDRVEADRDPVDRVRIDAAGAKDRVEHGVVGGDAGDADRLAREVGGRPDLVRVSRRSPRRAAAARCGDRDQVEARSRAMPKSLMSITAKSARPASSSLALSAVLDGSWIVQVDPGVLEVARSPARRRCPEWTAFGWKSRTRVAPFGAPGSAPPPPQAPRAGARRAAASGAATRLIRRRPYP